MRTYEIVELRDVTTQNFDPLIALQVADDQRDFLNPNVESIAWAYVAQESRPLAVYADHEAVGLVSYAYVPADGRCWINHFMVDAGWQRRGIGRLALEQLLARMDDVSGGAAIAVTAHPDNVGAIRLYEAFGFLDTGKRQNGELILRRHPTP